MNRISKIPRALVDNFSVTLFPKRRFLFAVHKREFSTGEHGNVRAANDFEQPQRVRDFLVAPGVAGDDRDAEDFRVRRIDQREQRLHVAAAGAGAILVEDDFPFGLRCGREGSRKKEYEKQKQRKNARGKYGVLVAIRKCFLVLNQRITEISNHGTVAIKKMGYWAGGQG